MTPVTFACRRLVPYPPEVIAAATADVSRWSEFDGYGPLPGIASAEYEERGEQMAGARIRVHNEDGSSHVETVEVWQPSERIIMRLHAFTPPLSRIASHFLEEWRFEAAGDDTQVTRQLAMYPRSLLARPFLWLISLLMRRAVARHLQSMAR